MKLKRWTAFLYFIFIASVATAQATDYEFLLEKIKENYAGFKDKAKGKSFQRYCKWQEKKYSEDTFKLLSAIVNYFEDEHLKLYAFNSFEYANPDTAVCRRNFEDILRHFGKSQGKDLDSREGYWVNEFHTMVIALKKIHGETIKYRAYLIELRNQPCLKGFPLAEMESSKHSNGYPTWHTNLYGTKMSTMSVFRNCSVFTIGELSKWKKMNSYIPGKTLNELPPTDGNISGHLIDETTYLLTLPDFNYPSIVDSILRADSTKLAMAKTLIIDLRDNSGGYTSAYSGLLPFIYTNPVISTSGWHYCSKDILDNYKEELESLSAVERTGEKGKRLEMLIGKMQASQGSFLYEAGDTSRLPSGMPLPKNVGIITNYACMSAAELMLLDFRQSAKVTVFGEATMGAVDYLNFFPIELPSKKYTLYVASFKREIPPGNKPLDHTGILPDVPISDTTQDWVEFVRAYYKRRP